MTDDILHSDKAILDLLRKQDSLTVSELADAIGVTATAVRQRLTRLLAQGMIRRHATKEGRGRPSHHMPSPRKGNGKRARTSPTWRLPCGTKCGRSKIPRSAGACCNGFRAAWWKCIVRAWRVRAATSAWRQS